MTVGKAIEMMPTRVLSRAELKTRRLAGRAETSTARARMALSTKIAALVPIKVSSSETSKWFGQMGSSQTSLACRWLNTWMLRPAVPITARQRHIERPASASVGVRTRAAMTD